MVAVSLKKKKKRKDKKKTKKKRRGTQEEKESIATRCLIVVELLKQEKTQRAIAEYSHVSIAKITRGSNELKRMPPKLIEFLRKNVAKT